MDKHCNLDLDGTKLPWHLDRVKKWYNGEKIAPITIEWALTPYCGYHCKFCTYDGKEKNSKNTKISQKAAFNFLEDIAEVGVKATSLASDGESTGNPILYDIIPYAKKLGLDTALSTNGFLLKQDRLEEILPYLTYLRFNFSGAEPKRYSEIMGVDDKRFYKVSETIKKCSQIKKEKNLAVTIGMNMVCMPEFVDQVIPFAKLGKALGVDYAIIKHYSDEKGVGTNYTDYEKLIPVFKEAEKYSDENYLAKVKWSKIKEGIEDGRNRNYPYCFGPAFMFQISGTGIIGVCNRFVQEEDKTIILGDITKERFKDIFNSDKYSKIINHLGSPTFSNKSCWPLCLQHKTNEFLWNLKNGNTNFQEIEEYISKKEAPQHINFI